MNSKLFLVLIIILSLNSIRYLFEYINDLTNLYYIIMFLLNIIAICIVLFSKTNKKNN